MKRKYEKDEEEDLMNEETGDEALAETLLEAVRGPQRGELEQLLASELAEAVFSTDPLQKIRHVLEAYQLLPEYAKKQVLPDDDEREKIKLIYELTISFLHMREVSPPTPLHWGRYAVIPWSFPTSIAHYYLYLFVKRIWDLGDYYRDWDVFTYERNEIMKIKDEKLRRKIQDHRRQGTCGNNKALH